MRPVERMTVRRPARAALALLVASITVVTGGVPDTISAQGTSAGPLVLEIASSAHAGAMGGAFPLGAGTADVLFQHPGALAGAQGVAAYRASYGGSRSMSAVAGATAWLGGTIGVGLRSLTYGGSAGLQGRARNEAEVRGAPTSATHAESVVSLGFARDVGPVQVGVVGKWVTARAGVEQDQGPSLDLGTAVDAGPGRLALSVRNLGGELSAPSGSLDTPWGVSLAASSEALPVWGLDLSASARIDRTGSGDVQPGGGVEVAWWPIQGRTFAARVGYARPVDDDPASGLTVGASFRGDQIGLSWAYAEIDDGRGVHRLGVTWR